MSDETITQTASKSGFDKVDIAAFKQKGDVQSIGTPDLITPQKKTFTRTMSQNQTTFLGNKIGEGAISTSESGFMGEFSDITDDQLNAMVNTFNNRKKLLLDKKRAPGRSQLFLVKGER